MLTADSALMGTHQPAFEERSDSMHPREHRVGGLAAPEENSSVMAIAELGEDTVARQPVGDHNGTRLDGFLYERKQALRRGAHHAPHSDPANRTAAHLRSNDDKCLLSDVPAPPTRLNPTDEGFVHLDRPGQTVPARPDHRTAKLVQPRPCGSIAAQAEDALPQRAGAVLLADDPPDSSEPGHQRRARILEERAGGHRRLVPTARAPARCTTPEFPRRWDTRIRAATGVARGSRGTLPPRRRGTAPEASEDSPPYPGLLPVGATGVKGIPPCWQVSPWRPPRVWLGWP